MKARSLFLIYLLVFLSSCQFGTRYRTPANSTLPLDIVFDLDWTLIAQVKNTEAIPSEELLRFEEETYRLAPGARELIAELLERDNIRISFFSGGGIERNQAVLSQIQINNRSALEIAYKVFSRNDLTDLSAQVSPEARFSERYKKDLRLINPDLGRIVIIEDNANFALADNQRANFIWLGDTFENMESWSQALALKTDPKYRPNSYGQWLSSRLKLPVVGEILKDSLPRGDEPIDFEYLHSRVKASELQSTKISDIKTRVLQRFMPQAPSDCQESIQLLLLKAI